ncbi:hypothetical protein [Moritella sp. F3]|uniref:hypothetical protein n=1 Tax=Moritella sp. F3 TaxID=2718882 RepID=UPI0018E19556|nr:hypothetical protein [Moritella sp. F3]GIC75349.1 hypothetical protein FMO001_00760 [Moritella sp. F1]GIC80494.1 hypothetical protein FMO003_07750 [Moritella sp. F3]
MLDIVFSEWFNFKDFEAKDGIEQQGTYIIGKFEIKPSEKVDFIDNNIIYVGETTQKLKIRLKAFSNSAFKRKNGHSGGWTFSSKYLDKIPVDEIPHDLYLSIYSPEGNSAQKKALAKFAERKVILSYCLAHGKYPSCNKT